jgi:hypothetical protein
MTCKFRGRGGHRRGHVPFPCGKPAAVTIKGMPVCAEHAVPRLAQARLSERCVAGWRRAKEEREGREGRKRGKGEEYMNKISWDFDGAIELVAKLLRELHDYRLTDCHYARPEEGREYKVEWYLRYIKLEKVFQHLCARKYGLEG